MEIPWRQEEVFGAKTTYVKLIHILCSVTCFSKKLSFRKKLIQAKLAAGDPEQKSCTLWQSAEVEE